MNYTFRTFATICILVAFHLFLGKSMFAQFGPPIPFDGSVHTNSAFVSADLNNDSLDDILMASQEMDRVAYWYCEGEGLFSEQKILSSTSNTELSSPVVSDFNNDGWNDIAYVNFSTSEIFICTNLQGLGFDEPTKFTTSAYCNTFKAAHLNNDSLPDLILNMSDGNLKIALNTSGNVFIESEDVMYSGGSYSVLDSDNDSDMDLASTFNGGLRIYQNDGSGHFSILSTLSFTETIYYLETTDLNGDGFDDVLVQEGYFGGKRIAWWRNNTDNTFTKIVITQIINNNSYFYSVFFAQDCDLDGDTDFVSSGYTSGDASCELVVSLNDGTGVFNTYWTVIPLQSGICDEGISGHFNSDNFIDFFVTNSETKIGHVILGDETHEFLTEIPFGSNTRYSRWMTGIDWDEDGDEDLMCHHLTTYNQDNLPVNGKISYFENNGNGDYESQQVLEDPVLSIRDPQKIDFDHDGDDDILYYLSDGVSLVWMENLAGTPYTNHYLLPDTIGKELLILDFNNDSIYDVVKLSSITDDVEILVLNESYQTMAEYTIGWPAIANNPMYLTSADLDNDGDQDVVFYSADNDKIVVSMLNYPTYQTFQLPQTITNASQVELADADTDGDIDILVMGSFLHWFQNDGLGNFTYSNALFNFEFFSYGMYFAAEDFDNDQDIDFVLPVDSLAYIEQTSPGNFTYTKMRNYAMASLVITSDINNDGFRDIIMNDGAIFQILQFRINEINEGCSDPTACNYASYSPPDNDNCIYPQEGDLNCNGTIDVSDFDALVGLFGCTENCPGDLDNDGAIDVDDLMMLLALIE